MARVSLLLSVVLGALAVWSLNPGRQATLRVYRLEEGLARQLQSGDEVHPGELVQATFHVDHDERAWVYSRDGRDVFTVHARGVQGGRWRVMPMAFLLDDAPGCEDFVLSTRALSPAELGHCGDRVPGAEVILLARPAH